MILLKSFVLWQETGIQNVGVAFLIITYNFPSPESDYAILPLISVSSLTTIPLWFLLLSISIKKKLKARSEAKHKASINDESKEEALLEKPFLNNEQIRI